MALFFVIESTPIILRLPAFQLSLSKKTLLCWHKRDEFLMNAIMKTSTPVRAALTDGRSLWTKSRAGSWLRAIGPL
jgi:hypothetical protein